MRKCSENSDSQEPIMESVEHATRKVPDSSLGHSLLFDENLGTKAICERIGKSLQKRVMKHFLEKV